MIEISSSKINKIDAEIRKCYQKIDKATFNQLNLCYGSENVIEYFININNINRKVQNNIKITLEEIYHAKK